MTALGALPADQPPRQPACRVFRSTSQALVGAAATAIGFNSERFDTDSMHDTVTNNSRITFNKAGIYVVTGSIYFDDPTQAGAYIALRIRRNGTTLIAADGRAAAAAGLGSERAIATVAAFAAADYIELLAYMGGTGADTVNATANAEYSPEFAAAWIGRT